MPTAIGSSAVIPKVILTEVILVSLIDVTACTFAGRKAKKEKTNRNKIRPEIIFLGMIF